MMKKLERNSFVKHLGVMIDNNFSWKFHKEKYRHYTTTQLFCTNFYSFNIYCSLIHPYISYGLLAWGQTSKANLNTILILQKRALRLIYFSSKREHAIPLFIRANILPVDMLYYKGIMHDIHCKTAPTNLIELFTNIDFILKKKKTCSVFLSSYRLRVKVCVSTAFSSSPKLSRVFL